MILSFLSSLRLTLALLLGLALVSVGGTVRPLAEGRYELFYQSHWFRALLALLALNMAVCTVKTVRRNLQDRRGLLATLHSEQVFACPLRYVLPRDAAPGDFEAALRGAGYRVDRRGESLLGRRGLVGRWGSTLVHLACLAVMAGALAGAAGFVGTLNIHVGDKSAVYFDWDRQQDLPLGYEFRLDHFEPRYYPIELRFVALDPQTREVVRTYTCSEGETVPLEGTGFEVRVARFIPEEEHLMLELYRRGEYVGLYHAFGGKTEQDNPVDPGFELRPVAFRDPMLKQLHSEVSILRDGQVVKQGVIEVNHPLVFEGVTIYQTAYNRDKFGYWYAGFQFSRDPGEAVVWGACIVLMCGLLFAFAVPWRAVGVTRVDDEVLLVVLAGFRGEAGEAAFRRLEEQLTTVQEGVERPEG